MKDFIEKLKRVQTENVYVLTNKDVELVKGLHFLPGNRPIKESRVKALVGAFKNGEYIPPILVSVPAFIVTEGNHRLSAALECIKLSIPFKLRIYCYQDESALTTARLINNTQERWKANDRLVSYVFERIPSYIKLKEFMDKYSEIYKRESTYAINAALSALSNGRTRQSLATAFNSGKLVLKDSDIKHACEITEELKIISEVLNTKSIFGRDHIIGWDKARTRLGISFNKFIVKLTKRAKNWEDPKDTIEAWFNAYMKIASGL